MPGMYSATRSGGILLIFAFLILVATASAASSMIQVNVHPGGGTVCLDTVCQVDQGTINEISSTKFENIETGRYYMLNIYGIKGYKPYLAQIYLDASGHSLARDIYLEPLPPSVSATATITVFITPNGGKVCLDDRQCEVSVGTPSGSWSVQYTGVTANTYHTITITNPGYQTSATQIHLLPGQVSTLDITLKPLPQEPVSSPTPLSSAPTHQPTTRADLSGLTPFIAIGIWGLAHILGIINLK
jgi:hypothetical protein